MQRNFILFIILSVFILAGWFWLVTTLPAPRKKAPEEKAVVQAKDKTAKIEAKKEEKKTEAKKTDEKKPEPKKEEIKIEAKKETPAKIPFKAETPKTLGGDGFHLSVAVTARGAAVQKVTLNRFKAANWRGEPTDRDLELIQDDPYEPSFRMYHYTQPDAEWPVFGLGEKIWKLENLETLGDRHEIQYSTTVPDLEHIKIVKTYRLEPRDYHVTLLVELHDTRNPKTPDQKPLPFRYQLTGGQGLPIEGEWYTSTFRNAISALVDQRDNVYRKLEDSMRISMRRGGDTNPENKFSRGNSLLQYAGVANQYFAAMLVVDNKQPKRDDGGVDADKILAWARPTLETTEKRGFITGIGADEIAFRAVEDKGLELRYKLLPRTARHIKDLELQPNQKAVLSYYETPEGDRVAAWIRDGETLRPQFDDITMRVVSEVVSLQPGDKVAHQFMLYHGPVKAALLAQFSGDKEVPAALVDRYTDTLHLRTMTDYHSDNALGKFCSMIKLTDLIILVTRFMHWLLHYLHFVFGYGLSIVVLTVMVRGAMFPISRRQALFSMKMQEMAPELKKIQEKHKDDPAAKMQATQEFYRKNGINPLGSCWPLFLQMPIFLGLYFALQESIHFRLADFLWIQSLAAPDMLLFWTNHIPVISSPDHSSGILGMFYLGPFLNVLPIIAAVLMLVQQIQTMPPPTDEQQAMQQNMMRYMTIFFGIMFYKVAAGLCIYFIASSLWGVAERKLLPKKKAGADAATPAAVFPPNPKTPGYIKAKGKTAKQEKAEETSLDKIKAWWKEVLKQAEKK